MLIESRTNRRNELHRIINGSRRILRAHLYEDLSVTQAVEKLLEPDWLRVTRRFSIAEWQKISDRMWRKATRLLRQVEPPDIVLYPGFGRCNGRVFRLGGVPRMVCSPDFPGTAGLNLSVLLAHEYAHFIRERRTGLRSDQVPIYAMLFEEGWASWFSRLLLPEAPLPRVLMSNLHALIGRPDPPGGYSHWCRSNLSLIASEILPVLNSRDPTDLGRFFQGRRLAGSDTPIRTGYYLGYRIVEHLSRRMTAEELITVRPSRNKLLAAINDLR